MSADEWITALEEAGFPHAVALPTDSVVDTGQHLLLAVADTPTEFVRTSHDSRALSIHGPEKTPASSPLAVTVGAPPEASLEKTAIVLVRETIAESLRMPLAKVVTDRPFQEMGMDSLLALDVARRLRTRLRLDSFPATLLFEHASVKRLADHLTSQFSRSLLDYRADHFTAREPTISRQTKATGDRGEEAVNAPLTLSSALQTGVPITEPTPLAKPLARTQERLDLASASALDPKKPVLVNTLGKNDPPFDPEHDIAIVGYACRFPGADGAEEFWDLLKAGRDAIGPMPIERLANAESLTNVPIGGFLRSIFDFDPLFFRISPAEAEKMEPRQRLFLEVAYQAVEHAGLAGKSLAGTNTGVFVGAGGTFNLTDLSEDSVDEYWATGLTPSVLASRVAYYLDWKGPCLTLDTACSSSLVALHLAVRSLRQGECSAALVGGVHVNVRPMNFAAFTKMGALAGNRRCKAFDDRADGFVPGEGVGAILLRPLRDAIAKGETIHGVIRGSATNNDGKSNGLTAPDPGAQRDVLLAAWRDATIDPRTLSYIEAHGTGTSLGDPIEVRGITSAFEHFTRDKQFCRLGSVKSNIGHAEPAAGIAGIIKVLLSFKHGWIPASLHVHSPNHLIAFEATPLVLNDRYSTWERGPRPRRAGVSAFGISGTNAHVV
ncbi:MAG: type I polyketide synthase, partial [Planctomycetota bacterium]